LTSKAKWWLRGGSGFYKTMSVESSGKTKEEHHWTEGIPQMQKKDTRADTQELLRRGKKNRQRVFIFTPPLLLFTSVLYPRNNNNIEQNIPTKGCQDSGIFEEEDGRMS
jgi:hypothetical protein